MGLLTIGSFARAARLSPKALRLYDDLFAWCASCQPPRQQAR